MDRFRVAVTKLCECGGCHDVLRPTGSRIRERVDFVAYPQRPGDAGFKPGERFVLGLIEGACASDANLITLQRLRDDCDFLVTLGDCARTGNLLPQPHPPASGVRERSKRSDELVTLRPAATPELPLLLDSVFPCHWVVPIDHEINGCPPTVAAIDLVLQRFIPAPKAKVSI